MGPYRNSITWPYEVSSTYLEHQALQGRFEDRVRTAVIQLDQLDDAAAARAREIEQRLVWMSMTDPPIVLGTGVDHSTVRISGDRTVSMPDEIYSQIGRLPRLDGPYEHGAALVAAYERWLRRYDELSLSVVRRWALHWARETPMAAGDLRAGIREDFWVVAIRLRSDLLDEDFVVAVDARDEEQFPRFRQARAALIDLRAVREAVGSTAMNAAEGVIGPHVWAEPGVPIVRAVDGYAAYANRLIALARAYSAQDMTSDEAFEVEMRAWAAAHGSKRLRLGLEGGYRMTPVYLDERLAVEAPGFYAARMSGKGRRGKERIGPSQAALELADAVQHRLRRNASTANLSPLIQWLSEDDLPSAMRAEVGDFFQEDGPGAVEVISITNWLGRYELLGVVDSGGGPSGWVSAVLDRSLYGLGVPPASTLPADDDIPF